MNMALDFGVTFALNSTHHISFPGAGDYDILYLSANTSYEFFPQVTSKDFGKMIYMQKITFKTGILHLFFTYLRINKHGVGIIQQTKNQYAYQILLKYNISLTFMVIARSKLNLYRKLF